MEKKYDFSGWATKNDLKCADGVTIRKNAFQINDGDTVPLVWQHFHDEPGNILGHADLENREEGVYAHCIFNDTKGGKEAKELVQNKDINSLSIWANDVEKKGTDVIHGHIREISLVIAGANPGAIIDYPVLAHSGMEIEDEIVLSNVAIGLELSHSNTTKKEDPKTKVDPKTEDPKTKVDPKTDPKSNSEDPDIKTVYGTFNEDQKAVNAYMIDEAVKEALAAEQNKNESNNTTKTNSKTDTTKKDLKQSAEGGDNNMKFNIFDKGTGTSTSQRNIISHDDMHKIMLDAKQSGSLKEAVVKNLEDGGVLSHAITDSDGHTVTYGVADIDYLFPDAQVVNQTPDFISREMGWVPVVMNAIHHSPFSRVKSIFANITDDEARAKGYIKGKMKKEEVFTLLKRVTEPQTVYKKQKIDRDDIIDITDFDVVLWIKAEMRTMLDEELARAFLVGDGRLSSDDDKIREDHIRPIYNDAALYTVKVTVDVAKAADDNTIAKTFIKSVIKARKQYKGSGNPTLFCTEDILADMLLIEDTQGRFIYTSQDQLATTLRVSSIVTVPVMDGVKSADTTPLPLMGVIVNLMDYNVGADKGGVVSLFDDFDIDYNQQKYLIETRCSGALVKPYSAMAMFLNEATA